jgi:chromosome segregation ATPase
MDQTKLLILVSAANSDAQHYEQDVANAQQAIQEASAVVSWLNQESTGLSGARMVYQRQGATLSATANAVRVLIEELRAVIAIMSGDLQDAEDSRKMGDTAIQPEMLAAQRTKLQQEHDALFSHYSQLIQVVNSMPAQVRPVIAGLNPQ